MYHISSAAMNLSFLFGMSALVCVIGVATAVSFVCRLLKRGVTSLQSWIKGVLRRASKEEHLLRW